MNFKLGFGPMSQDIIRIIADYAERHQQPLMLIASRNQIDADSGYVMHTEDFGNLLNALPRSYLRICRDHCGPYFLDAEKDLTQAQAIEACKKTIAHDIENGFDLIHIDTSRCTDGYAVADELIKFCLDKNPNIRFEFGTEENVGLAASTQKYTDDVNFAKQYANMEFVVAQTGSLVHEDLQVGVFDADMVQGLVKVANTAGVKLKEHNADYLTAVEIAQRRDLGIHALNIAPQLGVAQTKLMRRLALLRGLDDQWNAFAQTVIDSGKWNKWTESTDADHRVNVAGHYLFRSNEAQMLMANIPAFYDQLKTEIESILTTYVINFNS